MKRTLVVLGALLLIAGTTLVAYDNFAASPPLLGSESGQGASINYLAFFGFALGGAGVLILVFSFIQWYTKPRPK